LQPKYYNLDVKIKAREKNVEAFRALTGLRFIPPHKQYWTLANYQPPDCEGTEIIQMKNLDLISSDSQFYGVDYDKEIILQNRLWHPNANWIHAKWEEGIRSVKNFDPAFIYLDMTSFVSTEKVLHAINSTMHHCKKKTVLLVNLMLNDPRSSRSFDKLFLVSHLPKIVPPAELKKWRQKVNSFTYNATGLTDMKTFILMKEKN